MTDDHTRLENFKPFLRYDSNESYFADRACEMTDAPGNLLRSASGETIARAGPGERDLSLRFLVGACEHYPTGAIASEGDRLSIQGRDYLDQYRRIRPEGDYADVVYGRAVENEDSRWLQYWFWYFYDDVRALDVGLGLHEGDWEGIELRLDGEVPNLAVYAQHNYAEARHWDDVEKVGQRPVVYVALGSHASYFDDGMPITHWQRTKYFIDRSDGKVTPKSDVRLEILPGPAPGWARWPGHWGDTEKPT